MSLQTSMRSILERPQSAAETAWIIRSSRFADLVIISLCDLQIMTGLSILVAGFATLKEATYYHQAIVLQLWWLTLNSFWVARVEVEQSRALQTDRPKALYALTLNSPVWTIPRKLAVFCSIVLGLTYQGILDVQQWWGWDPEVEGLCYISHDDTSDWIWIAGTSLYGLTLLLVMLPWTKPFVVHFFDLIESTQDKLVILCKICWRESWSLPRQPQAILVRLLLVASSTMGLVLFSSLWHFIAIWSYGSGYYPVLLVAEVGFALWSTYDIVDLKVSNAHLVNGEESIWGFGQVFPVVILGLIGYQAMDAWNRSSD